MFSWAGGLGSGLGHSLGALDSSQTSLTRDISDINRHVLGKGTFPADSMDLADVISAQTQINSLLREIETLKGEVTHWKKLCLCSTRGPNTIDPETVWKLKSHIRDLEQRLMREMDEHQLEVAVLQNVHQQKLADLTDRHRQQLMDYQRQLEDLQNRDAAGNVNEDLLQEWEMELRRLKEKLTQTQRLNDSLNNLASDLRAEKQKLVLELQDARHQLEESILRNNEDSLKNNIAVRALKIEKGRLVAKLCRAEKKLLQEKSERSLKDWSPVDNSHFIQLGREKDLEILHLRKRIEEMDADHQETKELLSFALEEQKQLTECVREQDEYIKELTERPELQKEFGGSTETLRSHDILPPSVEDKDMRLPSMTDQRPHVDEDLERLTQQSRAVPLVDPKILEEIVQLECEVFQLNELKDDLKEEIKEQQKIIHNQQQGKRALLQSLQEQKEKVNRLQHRQEEMNTEHAQLLAAKDETIRILQVTLEELKAQLPDKSPQIPREPCEDEEVRASQPLPRENGSEERDPSKAEIQRLVQGIKEQELEMKLLTEQNIRLTEQVDRLSKEEIGKLTRIIQQKDVKIQSLSRSFSAASHSQNRHVKQLQWQLQECALKSKRVLAVLNEKTRENSDLKRTYQEMTHRLAAKEADLRRMQEKAAVCQRERDEVVLALTQKETETCALQKEVHQLRERELLLSQELERGQHLAAEAQDSRRREALASEDQVAQLREEVTVLQGKLLLSSAAMEEASHRASLQAESLREQLHVVIQQKEDAELRLAASQEEGRRYERRLANLKLELAEWMEKADALEGKLKSLQGRLHQTNADLEVKEDQLQEFKKQNEVQQEILEDTQKKLMTLVSQSEGMVDKTLLRRLFVGSFQAADAERQEALRLMASTLGIREDQLRQLRSQEPAGVPSGVTGGPGSQSAPNTPAKPNHQAVAKHSFSELFVQFLEAESHSAFPPPKPSGREVKPPHSGGRGKLPKKQGPPRLNATLGSTPPEKDVKPRTTAVSLINPLGPEMGGSEHLLLSAFPDALPTYTPHILSPAKKVGKAAEDLSTK